MIEYETYQVVITCFAFFSMGVIMGGLLADWSFFHYPEYWIKKVKKSKKFRNFCIFGYFYDLVKILNKRRTEKMKKNRHEKIGCKELSKYIKTCDEKSTVEGRFKKG